MMTSAIEAERSSSQSVAAFALGALGVVFGDIGTSPLYTLKTALSWAGGSANASVALAILSLIIWTLVIIASVKYVTVVMRADNDGEGGILALMSLLNAKSGERAGVIVIGILGAALLYGDGAITPAISVLSAIEGIKAPVPAIAPYVLPLAVVALVGVFALQPQGSGRIGKLYGPIMALWFAAIGILGAYGVLRHPGVFAALNPLYGLEYLFGHGWIGLMVLGGVFLCVTGAEALYADMGHFGRSPIRITWYGLVLPSLLLSYTGQTALVVDGGLEPGANPFFALSPDFLRVPLVVLATVATIIASQAIISGTFSMTRQAIRLGLCPGLVITQTSSEGYGQIFVGFVNWVLMLLTLGLALGFGSSDNLASAYGIAVSLTMLLTSILMYLAMGEIWGWSLPVSITVAGVFITIDVAFVAANVVKVVDGGWAPLIIAACIFFLMWTWREGRRIILRKLNRDTEPLPAFIAKASAKTHVSGTAVYLTNRFDVVPIPLLHNLQHNKVLHDRIILLHITTENVPRVADGARVEVSHIGANFHAIVARHGFMEIPNIPKLLGACRSQGLQFDLLSTSFFVGHVKIILRKPSRWRSFRFKVFEVMHRNAVSITDFVRIPPDRVVEFGGQIEI
jgi:KUP system potassium uptake protein